MGRRRLGRLARARDYKGAGTGCWNGGIPVDFL